MCTTYELATPEEQQRIFQGVKDVACLYSQLLMQWRASFGTKDGFNDWFQGRLIEWADGSDFNPCIPVANELRRR
jgi:hypothetical protein